MWSNVIAPELKTISTNFTVKNAANVDPLLDCKVRM